MKKKLVVRDVLFSALIAYSIFLGTKHVHQHEHNFYLVMMAVAVFVFGFVYVLLK